MNRSSVRLHLPEKIKVAIISKYEKAASIDGKLATQLDVCRCPKCDGPMTARSSRNGPYFHCLCAEKARICHKRALIPAAAPTCVGATDEKELGAAGAKESLAEHALVDQLAAGGIEPPTRGL
jgi:hypothetical protein